jgi:hypothetical protein
MGLPIGLLSYWKWIVLGLLLAALGVQTLRLGHAQVTIAKQNTEQAQFEKAVADQHAKGVEEGARQQAEAQKALDAKRDAIEAGLMADAAARAAAASAKAARLAKALEDKKWECLRQALPEEVLKEYRRP